MQQAKYHHADHDGIHILGPLGTALSHGQIRVSVHLIAARADGDETKDADGGNSHIAEDDGRVDGSFALEEGQGDGFVTVAEDGNDDLGSISIHPATSLSSPIVAIPPLAPSIHPVFLPEENQPGTNRLDEIGQEKELRRLG